MIDIKAIKAAADRVKGWSNCDKAWLDTSEDESAAMFGAICEEGVRYPVATVDCDQYMLGEDSLPLAKFYATANPATVIALCDEIERLTGGRVEFVERRIAALRAALAETAPVQEQQFTADELDLMRQWFESMQDTNRSFVIDADKKLHQKIIAAIQAAPRAEQPRKAVKLSDSEILAALEVEYVSSAQNRHLFLSDARTIEAAVWAKLGVTE